MHLVNPRESSKATLDSAFAAKYPWLLQWAMYFVQNDRAAAEDLVQDTFLRILSLRDEVSNLEDIEPLLYTHLRFAYLTERRRGLSHTFLGLGAVDFDTFAISLRRSISTSFDQIESQNELRKILIFFLWRRRSAKFASIFLLRFFHGFSPEEIASICLISRHSVDLALGYAREELKTYLVDPSKLHVLRRGSAPEYKPLKVAVPSGDFANFLMQSIFDSSCGLCPGNATLERYYQTLNLRPLESDLLAHIVSCKVCLYKVIRLCGAPPPPGRLMEDSLKPTRTTGKSKRSDSSDKDAFERIFAGAQERVREVFEHRPSGLVIALNAEVVAVRNIGSSCAILKVETRSIENVDMIEVFSEQGMLMLSLEILHRPPQAPPELRREIALSDDRILTVAVRFTADGAVIEAIYIDPHFVTVSKKDEEFDDLHSVSMFGADDVEAGREETKNGFIAGAVQPNAARAWWNSLAHGMTSLLQTKPFVPITAAVLVLASSTLLWVADSHQRDQLRALTLINESVSSERNQRIAHGPGAVHQRVTIHFAGRALQREIYRDIDGRRRPKAQPADKDERLLKAKLEEAGLDWNDPLSSASFQAWHDHAIGERDRIEKTESNLLTVTTTTTVGPVLSESLTVRLSDLHPVARSLRFRDQRNVEIAELSYDVVPWGPVSEGWFEQEASALSSSRPRSFSLPQLSGPAHPSESDIDIARLGVLLALQELHADTERLQISQTESGISVTGIVEDQRRKQEISDRLRMIPNVTAEILSYRDFASKPGNARGESTIKAMSVVDGESPLDSYCESQRVLRDRCQQFAFLLLSSSATLVRENNRLGDLQHQYPSTKPLSPAARVLLNELMRQHINHLASAVKDQEDIFPALGIGRPRGADMSASDPAAMEDAVQHNLLLAKELVYAGDEHSRSAPLILHDLVVSTTEVRTAISRIPVPATDHAIISSSTLTPHHN
ncbi:RNA polymerase sigma factor [Telmatobacter bradus]|uniref:RNA polymerase sigma factor n=1 Tax=Telmatobacter bradus TaxID=474953 RepID=UPI003B42F0F4